MPRMKQILQTLLGWIVLNAQKKKKKLFSYLNIDSIMHKFQNLKEVVSNYDDILVIAETKIDINRSLQGNLWYKDFANL